MKKSLVLLLLFALACTSVSNVDPVRVAVTIESRPDAGEAYVDGKFIGTTPMVARLTPGEHTIEVRHPERAAWRRELTVIADSPTRVTALLPR